MMKYLFFISMTLLVTNIYSQTTKEMLLEIKGKWQLDDNGNVNIIKTIEVPELKKEEIFNRALNYFSFNYVSGKASIQIQDKQEGLVVGKGLYENVHMGISVVTTQIDTWNILRVEVKDGRATIIVTLSEYEKKIFSGTTLPAYTTIKVAQEYPINKKGPQRKLMTKAFYKSFKKANITITEIERAIKEGNNADSPENNNW